MEGLAFKQRVEIELIKRNMSKAGLCAAVKERTGLYCDYSLLRKVFSGEVPGKKIREAVCEILEITA